MFNTKFDKVEYLKAQHTRILLGYLAGARKCGGYWCPFDHKYNVHFTIDEIKAELSTREHIPNKREGKRLRRERAKKGR